MNYIKIFYFLIAIELITSLISNQNYAPKKTDFKNCREQDTSQCSSYKLESKAFQCCYSNYTRSYDDKSYYDYSCDVMLNPLQLALDEIKTENGKLMFKEYYGFEFFVMYDIKENLLFKNEYSCSDGKYSFGSNTKDYTEKEKEIFKSNDYCLRPLIKAYRPEKITKETCFNSKLATTGNSGISCGYYEMKLYFNTGTNSDYKTCFLFNEDTLKNKNVGRLFKINSEEYSILEADEDFNELSYYQITMTNPKGRYFIYNSKDYNVTIDTDINSAKVLGSKYLLVFILLLI